MKTLLCHPELLQPLRPCVKPVCSGAAGRFQQSIWCLWMFMKCVNSRNLKLRYSHTEPFARTLCLGHWPATAHPCWSCPRSHCSDSLVSVVHESYTVAAAFVLDYREGKTFECKNMLLPPPFDARTFLHVSAKLLQ